MAPKYLREIQVYADDTIVADFKGGFVLRFSREVCCITERYCAYLSRHRLQTDGVAKVCVEMTDARHGAVAIIPEPHPLIDIVSCKWPFDFVEYHEVDEGRKKEMIATATRDCLLVVAEQWKWDSRTFHGMYDEAAADGFAFTGMSKASWPDPSGKCRVRVAFDWGIHDIALFAVLLKNRSRQELIRKPLGTMPAGIAMLHFVFPKENGSWISATEFELKTTDWLQKQWRVSFDAEMGAK